MRSASDEHIPRPAMTFDINIEYFARVARATGWLSDGTYNYDQIAAELGVTGRQVRRVLDRVNRPGEAFMAGLLEAVDDVRFRLMFPRVTASDPIGKE
jgi:hypothetical protein